MIFSILKKGRQAVKHTSSNSYKNAVEVCSYVLEEQRFVRLENKYQSGKLLLIITNSKTGERNESLKTTKRNSNCHGYGVQSVRRVVEKYNGTVSFTDEGEVFEASVMLYGIEAKGINAKCYTSPEFTQRHDMLCPTKLKEDITYVCKFETSVSSFV